ncbi:hypothetical protein EDEG_01978 [Edhazardia aedis USNM 41457]|uniref:Ribosomal RNA large subunit methyltransferase K/L-like methyltransferase domain-containing protein n=1 Tax=Edhazardia aedis (strain USNM 41457) TaxID=1003232 RepID=J9DMB7_EDHAE|nr:hypothetical protein EDEG_01978 [Edhazardia aedis USNM 41457]|eukprot:EJW03740.1 hypothetical protein EDEG_01978 [Edhazardia aedis USNM 41457]
MIEQWLIHLAATYEQFMFVELREVLNQTDEQFELEIPDYFDPIALVKCAEKQIDHILNRAIFVKSASRFEFDLKKNTSLVTAKIKLIKVNIELCNENAEKIIEDNMYLLDGTKYQKIKPQRLVLLFATKKSIYKTLFYRESERRNMLRFDVPKRPFIGITAMDWELSIMMSNLCNVNNMSLVIDPFVGSGGILMASALFDSNVIGIEKNLKSLIGQNERKGNVRTQLKGTKIGDNFSFLGKSNNLICIFLCDMTKINFNIKADAIITDPPYGCRISLKSAGCVFKLEHLKNFCDKFLKVNGKICFWAVESDAEKVNSIFISYKFILSVPQKLAGYYRTLYLYQKL